MEFEHLNIIIFFLFTITQAYDDCDMHKWIIRSLGSFEDAQGMIRESLHATVQ